VINPRRNINCFHCHEGKGKAGRLSSSSASVKVEWSGEMATKLFNYNCSTLCTHTESGDLHLSTTLQKALARCQAPNGKAAAASASLLSHHSPRFSSLAVVSYRTYKATTHGFPKGPRPTSLQRTMSTPLLVGAASSLLGGHLKPDEAVIPLANGRDWWAWWTVWLGVCLLGEYSRAVL